MNPYLFNRKAQDAQNGSLEPPMTRISANRNPPLPSAPSVKSAVLLLLLAFSLLPLAVPLPAATFSGNARVEVQDSTGALGGNINTVSCWFKLSIPSSTNLNNHLVVLMNSRDGNEGTSFSYLVRFNYQSARVEYLARGSSGTPFVRTLIDRPYLERWYHIAVARRGNFFSAYVDGRNLSDADEYGDVGDSANTSGACIGGVAGASPQFLLGEVQEVAIYSACLAGSDIRTRMWRDQRAYPNIRGYFKLGYSTNSTDRFRNFAPNAPTGTDPATPYPNDAAIAFEETDQAGEQSAFDSRKNGGADALTPLSGAISWSQVLLARPTPGIAFAFRLGYSSGTPTSGATDDPYSKRMLGPGWRHTFDARIYNGETSSNINLLMWEGSVESWVKSATNARVFVTRHKEYRGDLTRIDADDGTVSFEWTTPERLVYRFMDPNLGDENLNGRLVGIRDFNSNLVQVVWDQSGGYVSQVLDSAELRRRQPHHQHRLGLRPHQQAHHQPL